MPGSPSGQAADVKQRALLLSGVNILALTEKPPHQLRVHGIMAIPWERVDEKISI